MAIITTTWAIASYIILFRRLSENQRAIAGIAVLILIGALIADLLVFVIDQELLK